MPVIEPIRVFSCHNCKKLFTEFRVWNGQGCPRCGDRRLSPAYPSWLEALRLSFEAFYLGVLKGVKRPKRGDNRG